MRGLNKPSSEVSENIGSDQEKPIQTTDENGMTFLVDVFKNTNEKGSNLIFGNDGFLFSLQSEEKKFFVDILLSFILSQIRSFFLKIKF